MRNTKIKRFLLVGVTLLGVLSIFGATLFVHNVTSHASPVNPYQVGIGALKNAHPKFADVAPKGNTKIVKAQAGSSTCLPGLDSISNFCGTYTVPGFDNNGKQNSTWQYNMVGNAPSAKGSGTTTINAPIIPVAVQLLDQKGNVALTYDPMQYVKPVLKSPVFSTTNYSSSSTPTQFTDAEQRAEFYNQAKSNWHTMLAPNVKPEETMKIPYGSYYFALNSDGTCCQFVLVDINEFQNLLFPSTFPFDNSTPIGQAENTGAITTKDISTFLFPNTYLYFNGDPNQCCVLGFHEFDFEPGVPSNGNAPRAYIMNYSSWISPGLFGGGFQDVTALSHEMAETFNDPFVQAFNNLDLTPWWLSGGASGLCQNNLEVGDVLEVLANPTFPIKMGGMTYHPQTEALLQWFESNHTSNAIDGAYSYPDETALTDSNISQNFNCTPPIV